MKQFIYAIAALLCFSSCSEKYRKIDKNDVTVSSERLDSVASEPRTKTEIREDLLTKGYQIFDVVDEKTKDTVIMQQYFVAFLKTGSSKIKDDEATKRIQKKHLAHLKRMYELGYADISGPLGDVNEIINLTIYSVPSIEIADSLANSDPMVKEGFLTVEVHPWWVPKGYALR